MSGFNPTDEEFLCVVSGWQSVNQRGGLLGNAFPVFCLSRREIVTNPREIFPNPGYVFLLARGDLACGDFVILQPSKNEHYKNASIRECYYLEYSVPVLADTPAALPGVAAMIEVPDFDPKQDRFEIISPPSSVTPIFFVKGAGQRIYGPLLRRQVVREFERLEAIIWTCANNTNVIYEFSLNALCKQGVTHCCYEHPDPEMNEVVSQPLEFLVGPVSDVKSESFFDKLDDAELVAWYVKWRNISDPSLDTFLKLFRLAAPSLDGVQPSFLRHRCDRLQALISTAELLRDERNRIVESYLLRDEGRKAIDARVEVEIQQRSTKLDEEVRCREQELASKKQRLNDDLAAFEEECKARRTKLDGSCRALESRRDQLNTELERMENQLRQSADALAKKVSESSPLLAALRLHDGRSDMSPSTDHSPGKSLRPVWSDVEPISPTKALARIPDEQEFIDLITDQLAARGLYFTRDFIANIYICLKSSQIVLITSPPGYGKSSLVRELSSAIGHADSVLDIPVRRSWSDDRYLLGFYDTFHGRYDPGPTGLVSHLHKAEVDWGRDGGGIYFVLLDEFNLAAPEYYFSQFIQRLGSESVNPCIKLFDNCDPSKADTGVCEVKLCPNVRFWGTINYDETTERLSPRVLDRTGMIFLKVSDAIRSGAASSHAIVKEFAGIAAKELLIEKRKMPESCPEEWWTMFTNSIDSLQKPVGKGGPRITVSPRTLLAVQAYLANANGLISIEKAVDFVFEQRVLPLLRGRGEEFRKRMEDTRSKLADSGCTRSAEHMSESLRVADSNFGDIDFFMY